MSASMSGGPRIQVPLGPLETPPFVEIPGMTSIESARAIWRHALRGLPLGAYDLRIVEWAETGPTDQPSLIALASLLERARAAAVPQCGDAVEEWLTEWRDRGVDAYGKTPRWYAVNAMLLDYQGHADTGTPLDRPVPETPAEHAGGEG